MLDWNLLQADWILCCRATIVQDVNIYWTERHSRIPRDPRGGDVPKCAATCSYTNHLLLLIGVASYLLARKSN